MNEKQVIYRIFSINELLLLLKNLNRCNKMIINAKTSNQVNRVNIICNVLNKYYRANIICNVLLQSRSLIAFQLQASIT